MKLNKKLLRAVCIFIVTALFICMSSGCIKENNNEDVTVVSGFSVHFIDVGNGDCIFIRFPDGKNMLIDCGENSQSNLKNIDNILKTYSVTTIDYFVLTHPDADHVGNAESIVNSYTVNKAFIPNIYNGQDYKSFYKGVTALQKKGVEIVYSRLGDGVLTDTYFMVFLSPCASLDGDVYGEFNGLDCPTDAQINDLSPMIYVEYSNVSFLFTGDASKTQEKLVEDNVKLGIYNQFMKGKIDLSQVDFLKVAHHGADDCSSQDFLNMVQPQNAIISVGGNNIYGHPSSRVLDRLYLANPNVNLLRTDVCGNICISVSANGEYEIYR